MKNVLLVISTSIVLLVGSTQAVADNKWKEQSLDAWIDGRAEATLLFNPHLNSFAIDTDVENGMVTLTGKVDNAVDKALAEELVMGISGVNGVHNNLVTESGAWSNIESGYVDKKIHAVVTSRYLFSAELSALDIDVNVEDKKVFLNGVVGSKAERNLAEEIANNISDVEGVENNLDVEAE